MANHTATAEALEELAAGLRRVLEHSERVVIGSEGQPAAALIPYQDFQLLDRLIEEEEDRIENAAADEILEDIDAGRTRLIPWEGAETQLDQLME